MATIQIQGFTGASQIIHRPFQTLRDNPKNSAAALTSRSPGAAITTMHGAGIGSFVRLSLLGDPGSGFREHLQHGNRPMGMKPLPILVLAVAAPLFAVTAPDSSMKPLFAPASASDAPKPIHWAVGLTVSPSQFGEYGEVIFRDLWAFQIQHYDYSEFAGNFSSGPDPLEKYSLISGNVGAVIRAQHLKVGVLSGLGVMDGVTRGKLKSTDDGSGCLMMCSGPGSTYERVEGRRLAIPLKLLFGFTFGAIGFNLTPQVYFVEGRTVANAALALELGAL
jgi:hypothetical protein